MVCTSLQLHSFQIGLCYDVKSRVSIVEVERKLLNYIEFYFFFSPSFFPSSPNTAGR